MDFSIRLASQDDMPQVHHLIEELAIFEKEPHAVEVTIDDLKAYGFGANPQFTCFVAEVGGEIHGAALIYTRFSTWKGVVLHLEDLIVKKNYRGSGLGTALLDEVVKHGHHLGVRRISWEVLDWNEPAIEFYQKKGADVKRDWDVVHLNEVGIENYLSNIQNASI